MTCSLATAARFDVEYASSAARGSCYAMRGLHSARLHSRNGRVRERCVMLWHLSTARCSAQLCSPCREAVLRHRCAADVEPWRVRVVCASCSLFPGPRWHESGHGPSCFGSSIDECPKSVDSDATPRNGSARRRTQRSTRTDATGSREQGSAEDRVRGLHLLQQQPTRDHTRHRK